MTYSERKAAEQGLLYKRKVIGDARTALLRRIIADAGGLPDFGDMSPEEAAILAELGLKPTSARRSKGRRLLFGRIPLDE